MQYPTWAAGQRLTAALLAQATPVTLVQSVDQTVNNSATLVDSTDLQFTTAANAIYIIVLRACYGSDTGPDIKFNWRVPSGAFLQRYCVGPQIAATTETNTAVAIQRRSSSNGTAGGTDSGTFADYHEDVLLRSGAGGTVALQFAQNTATASNTSLRLDSYLTYQLIA